MTAWDEYDPNDHERTGQPGYEQARSESRLSRMIRGYDEKEKLFRTIKP